MTANKIDVIDGLINRFLKPGALAMRCEHGLRPLFIVGSYHHIDEPVEGFDLDCLCVHAEEPGGIFLKLVDCGHFESDEHQIEVASQVRALAALNDACMVLSMFEVGEGGEDKILIQVERPGRLDHLVAAIPKEGEGLAWSTRAEVPFSEGPAALTGLLVPMGAPN